MTKKLLIIALTGVSSTMAFAADLFVRNAGAGGAYSTITAAITAASDGDRIIIQPKANGEAYIENLIINKSLTFVSETNYSKYILQGGINIDLAAGRVVTITNLKAVNSINGILSTGAAVGGRTTINILNCELLGVTTTAANTTTNISGCNISGPLQISHGICTANKASFITVYSFEPETSMATSDVEVYGNISTGAIANSQPNYTFKFHNNFCEEFWIRGIKDGSSNEIMNNTVYRPAASNFYPAVIYIGLYNNSLTNTGNLAIMNNAVSFVPGQSNICIQNNHNNVNVTASYNVFTNPFVTQGNMTQSNNVGSANMNFNNTTYTVTGMNENAGNPELKYTDLDLTRNDAGHYGGSNSWVNYWPANVGNKPQINYLSTPRTISSGTLNISGSGFSK
ncbi:hypothetical protein EG347_06625 [Chryseobacterium sp. G0186]|uniref:hypothetical protein n=1 Tax=Chryseobacterium sp. G0186 TaxID=2487064 RepID=UPI000F4EA10F|nr:hypothetical protein [Chryseobacterium sp. G0186]AZA77200.1 hypothetical protein EG347_06625 [Chryseobacterium sp. G0186]